MNRATRQGLQVFAFALLVRSLAAVTTTLTTLNPESDADVIRFQATASLIARGLRQGQPFALVENPVTLAQLLVPTVSSDIHSLWGLFLAPFWLLPGPSGLYARLGNAVLGALAIYNVYVLARYYHSHEAGVVGTLPMTLYPSFVAVHSTVLREAIVLFGITAAVRLLSTPSRRSKLTTFVVSGAVLHVALLQRSDNLIIYTAAFGTAVAVWAGNSGWLSKRAVSVGTLLSPVAALLALPYVRDGIDYLARIRRQRAKGRTIYLPEVVPRTLLEFVAFTWVGAVYFLYAPFPWMVETLPDLLVSAEGLVSVGFTVAAAWGVRSLGRRNAPLVAGLVVGLVVAVVLYGVGTVNYGTAMRHRQMFLWVVFLLGGIGISDHVRLTHTAPESANRRDPGPAGSN